MKEVTKSKNISIQSKIKIVKVYVWTFLLYGCEQWNVDKEIEGRIKAAEMWFLWRILPISWTDSVTHETVLRWAGLGREQLKTVRKRYSHVLLWTRFQEIQFREGGSVEKS